jgi:hypothetical protein
LSKNKKPQLFLRNGVYPDFQTIQPPGYLKRVKARVDGEGQKCRLVDSDGIV